MSDEERVSDLFGRLAAQGVELDDRDLAVIAEAFSAIRLEERRTIVAWLRRGPIRDGLLADRIGRGEHEARS